MRFSKCGIAASHSRFENAMVCNITLIALIANLNRHPISRNLMLHLYFFYFTNKGTIYHKPVRKKKNVQAPSKIKRNEMKCKPPVPISHAGKRQERGCLCSDMPRHARWAAGTDTRTDSQTHSTNAKRDILRKHAGS